MKFAQLVMGPAGSGKSSFCAAVQQHCEVAGRTVRVVNLDPAAEVFNYKVATDIRDLISVEDVMGDLGYGPNGGLVYCIEYLAQNMEWLEDELSGYVDDDYILIDCPGQIELYTHIPVMKTIISSLQNNDWRVGAVYMMDAMFVSDVTKLISGTLTALSTMLQLELPHINVLSKCDMVDKAVVDKFLEADAASLCSELDASTGPKFARLNAAICSTIDSYNLVSYVPLSAKDEDSIDNVLAQIDNAIQYGEDLEPREPHDEAPDDGDNDHDHDGDGDE